MHRTPSSSNSANVHTRAWPSLYGPIATNPITTSRTSAPTSGGTSPGFLGGHDRGTNRSSGFPSIVTTSSGGSYTLDETSEVMSIPQTEASIALSLERETPAAPRFGKPIAKHI